MGRMVREDAAAGGRDDLRCDERLEERCSGKEEKVLSSPWVC